MKDKLNSQQNKWKQKKSAILKELPWLPIYFAVFFLMGFGILHLNILPGVSKYEAFFLIAFMLFFSPLFVVSKLMMYERIDAHAAIKTMGIIAGLLLIAFKIIQPLP